MTADLRAHLAEATISIEAALVILEGSHRSHLENVHELLKQALDALDRATSEDEDCVVQQFPKPS